MDSWFVELFEILSKQTDMVKTDRFLPELYSEFDILTRSRDLDELQEIYKFVRSANPLKTTNSSYNDRIYIELRKEIIQRLLLLNDFSMIDLDINELLVQGNQRQVDEYLRMWKNKSIVYNRLKDLVDRYKAPIPQAKKTPKPKPVEEPEEEIIEEVPEEQETIISEPAITEEKEIIAPPVTEPTIRPTPNLEDSKKADTTAAKTEPIKQAEPEPEILSPKVIEIEKDPEKKSEPTIKTPPVETKTKPEIKKVEARPKKQDTKIEEIPKRVEKQKPEPKKPVIIPKQTPEPEPVKPRPKQFEMDQNKDYSFFDFVNLMYERYKIKANIEMLNKMGNPNPTYYRAVIDYIDSEPRDAIFFIDMINFVSGFNHQALVALMIDRSIMLKKLTNFNIAMINEKDIDNRCELLGLLGNDVLEHISLSRHEKKLHKYVKQHEHMDEIAETLQMHAYTAASAAPSMIEAGYATEAIDYFINNVISIKHQLIDIRNMSQIYWSMILAATLGIYVKRSHVTDYTESMDWISGAALLLAEKYEDHDLRATIKTLATSYIQRIYRLGAKSDDYDDWWERQRDDLRSSRDDNLASVSSIL